MDQALGLQSHLTGIEIGQTSWGWSKRKAFNRTSLELKWLWLRAPVDQYRTPSIAPHWNWNIHRPDHPGGRALPSIAPHWNWNAGGCSRWDRAFPAFNRTSLELKYRWQAEGRQVHRPSIAPHWNWNFFNAFNASPKVFLQSHLTGIEIFFRQLCRIAPASFNRTSLELKYSRVTKSRSGSALLQSHLTGIEIGGFG